MEFDCLFHKEESNFIKNVTSYHRYDVMIQNDTISDYAFECQLVNLTINFCGSSNKGID